MKKFIYEGEPSKISGVSERFGISYNALTVLLRKGEIRLNGRKIYDNETVRGGDEITVYTRPQKPPVIYEDMNILAVYKRKGIKSDGGDGFEGEIRETGGDYGAAELCHRLDTNTDGIVLFAKDAATKYEILGAFRAQNIEKRYLALVFGAFDKDGLYTAYSSKDDKAGTVFVSGDCFKGCERIETRFSRVRFLENSGLSVVDVAPITGKTHQIRAHLRHLGFFILGDGKYGDERVNRRFRVSKQQLTAYKIGFNLPETSILSYLNGKVIELKNPESFLRIPNSEGFF
ncbi:MAG: RluA family pseudouridine synthase [Clostridiales bacterium]|jgi:23S rRNA-/tRNA-specific pseudouridylate synthase|nr:RluA family pseudouridine synthase [Clostridiales bacterium]